MNYILQKWPVSDEEYRQIDELFGSLGWYASHQLKRRNFNNTLLELEDISQELKLSMLCAGSYYKRFKWISECLSLCKKYAKRKKDKEKISELEELFENRKHHGAGRQLFSEDHEDILHELVSKIVPEENRPEINVTLIFDKRFSIYCKSILWNRTRTIGKSVTRAQSIRQNLVSLSYDSHENLISDDGGIRVVNLK